MGQFLRDLEASGIPKEDLARMTVSQILTKFMDGNVDQASDDDACSIGPQPFQTPSQSNMRRRPEHDPHRCP